MCRIARLVQSQDPTIHEQKRPGVYFTARLHLKQVYFGYVKVPHPFHGVRGAMDISKNIYAFSTLPAMIVFKNRIEEFWDTFYCYLNFCDEFETKGGASVKGTDHELRRKKKLRERCLHLPPTRYRLYYIQEASHLTYKNKTHVLKKDTRQQELLEDIFFSGNFASTLLEAEAPTNI